MEASFINLTNGLEYLPLAIPKPIHFCRIESTTIEHCDWLSLFSSLDHNLLQHLALGFRCTIYDCGCRRETSKVISIGVPLIRGVLERFWLGKTRHDGTTPGSFTEAAEYVYKQLFVDGGSDEIGKMKRKLGYYRRFLDTDEVKLCGKSMLSEHDTDKQYFKDLLLKWKRTHASPK